MDRHFSFATIHKQQYFSAASMLNHLTSIAFFELNLLSQHHKSGKGLEDFFLVVVVVAYLLG